MEIAADASGAERSDASFFSQYGAALDMALRIGDLAIVGIAGAGMHALRFGTVAIQQPYRGDVVLAALLALLVFPACSLYRSWRGESLGHEILRVWAAWAVVLAALLIVNWAMKTTAAYSRVWLGGWFMGGAVLFAVHRAVARLFLRQIRARGVDARKVVIVGATHAGRKIAAAMRNNPWTGLQVVGYVATPYDEVAMEGTRRLGDIDSLLKRGDALGCEQLWIALPMRAEGDIRDIVDALENSAVTLRLVPDLFGYELLNQRATELAGVPVITLRGSRITGRARVLKLVEDRVLSALILILISPVMALLAIGVKLSSPGPVFYRQTRVGLDGKEFRMLKFRSMPVNVEAAGVKWGSAQSKPVTRLGRLMRRTSLDELPQFINVLRGDMSIVGPRPERPMFVEQFRHEIPAYMQKHLVKAGITGWAQIHGLRGDTDLGKRIEYDLFYIRNWSLMLDLQIIARTAVLGFFGKNAY